MLSKSLVPMLLVPLVGCVPEFVSDSLGDDVAWDAPENSWPLATPPEALEGEGFYEGDIVPDFRLVDQYGDVVSLWQFHGNVVVLDISTMWCAPCRELGEESEAIYRDFGGEGLIYVTVLPENVEGGAPSVEDLNLWVDAYGLTTPVVADPGEAWAGPAVPQDQYPFVAVVDRDMRVAVRPNPPTDSNVRAGIEAVLARE